MKHNEIDIITLGCSKNLVDTERVMQRMEQKGFHCVHNSAHPKGEICIINTCGFIGDAKEESIRCILENAERKKRGELHKLIVMGCLSQRYSKELPEELPEVDEWYGKFEYDKVIERVITTPRHYAYLKISEGCNRFCSYCAIPLITGRHRSVPIEDLLQETRWLVQQGVKEVNVIAQDLSSYGMDLYGEKRLAELIDKMAGIEGLEWIRLHYAYPTDFPYDILPVIAKHSNVCKYLDLALQHCTDHMLSGMRRHITRAEQDALIDRIRREVPGITLRTTLMVGHPGESEEDFEALKAYVRQMRFDRMGAFAYSEEEGTWAAEHYEDNIPDAVKQRRLGELMAIQEKIAAELNEAKVGKVLRTIIDRQEGAFYVGRTEADSPDVDCEVLIPTSESKLKIGEFYDITITGTEGFDLYGKL